MRGEFTLCLGRRGPERGRPGRTPQRLLFVLNFAEWLPSFARLGLPLRETCWSQRYMPGYFPMKNSTMSMLSEIPCATIGTARLRPVRR